MGLIRYLVVTHRQTDRQNYHIFYALAHSASRVKKQDVVSRPCMNFVSNSLRHVSAEN